ncbi:DUF4349 domain-containing protein [Patescibacteria group bacterium]|nr:DUF4349 domain-containing protein [Patescibacteria group bacterium]MCG2702250.1 DUF4349 domain-containing protein [Candidatus Parcubacteria bacterium]MBU4264736.1 DUF4349 domain-containing protein [Patescibacteria group bacterium]MBU4390074.1 DUF4349 domain-containing protein [Patescibacteria group bacterium]MBU4397287.1 DUF4349 domain-containing protein [Patescibacteria group bacterium]
MSIIKWLKKNWFTLTLLIIIAYLIKQAQAFQSASSLQSTDSGSNFALLESSSKMLPETPPSQSQPRMVTKDTNLSLLVKNVRQTIDEIENMATQTNGYMVDSHLSSPEGADSGNITIRVPSDNRQQILDQLRSMAVKVVSETVYGRDVTDEYEDLDAKLEVLYKTKSKFEEIFSQASKIPDLLNVQRELVSLQQQIDSLRGRQEYLSQSAKLTKIMVYLSTDELELPYSPTKAWRPKVIFKTAVRSLILNLRSLGNLFIWALVYSPILIVIFLVIKFFQKRKIPS